MELREAIDKLFEMTDEQRYELFEHTDVEDILNTYVISVILNIIEDFYSKPKYGDVYVRKFDGSILSKKCIFLSDDSKCDKYWLLFNGTDAPQEYTKSNFERNYAKTGKNVADKLQGLFE